MLVSVDTILKDINGIPFIDGPDKQEVKLKKIIVEALLAQFQDEQSLGGEEKMRRWQLASKVHVAENDIELTAEEITLIKKLIGKGFGVQIVGVAYTILEGRVNGFKK